MSATKELKERAAMALQALRRGDQPEAERLLEADAKGFMPGPAPDLTSAFEVTKLQTDFQTMRRRAGGIPAAICIVAPQRDKPGAFRFHFSGHDAVVKLLQGKAGLRVSEAPPPAPAPNLIQHPGKPGRWICAGCSVDVFEPEWKCQTEKCPIKILPPDELAAFFAERIERETPAPVDELAAKRAEIANQQPPTTP